MLKRFFAEAKQRRVFRVAFIYVLVSWIVIQVGETTFPSLDLPDWALTFVIAIAALGFPIAVVLAWAYDLQPATERRVEPTREVSNEKEVTDRPKKIDSIAVLPFVDLSPGGDQEYFADGMAEEVINALTGIEDLHVAARTSSFALRGQDQPAGEIGAKLNVGALLEGSVRTADNRVRITAQLIDVADGFHLWSGQYDREMEDVFAIQDEIACAIVETLKCTLGVDENTSLVSPGTADLQAYTLYLKGRYYWSKRTAAELEKGIELFEEAIEIDPTYALAWAGLADSYSILGWYRHLPAPVAYEKTEAAALRAVAIDDSLAEAYTSLAYARFLYAWDWTAAESDFQRAIRRNPTYPVAHHWYAEFLMAMGRFDEAGEQVKRAQVLDPLSHLIGIGVGFVDYFAGRYEEAIEQYERVLERAPALALAPWFLGPACVEAGLYDRAIEVYEDWLPRVQRKGALTALLARAYAVAGRRDEAVALVTQLEKEGNVAPDNVALVYSGLGEFDLAFHWLNKALQQRVWTLAFFKVEPAYACLRSDERFAELLIGTGLDRTPSARQNSEIA